MSTRTQFLFSATTLTRRYAKAYEEFINISTLRSGVYTLAAGSVDPQQPHTEDELYYVISGKSSMHIGEEVLTVEEGDLIFVPAFIEHHFYDITEDLQLLVFFSKATPDPTGGITGVIDVPE